jgi:hypothetical protein
MAFSLFKKKNVLDYPEEKASVLEQQPAEQHAPSFEPIQEYSPEGSGTQQPSEEPQFPERREETNFPPEQASTSSFRTGFRNPEELRPPMLPPPEMREAMSASMGPPPQQEYQSLPQIPGLESGVFGPQKTPFGASRAPHIYIRINKYKEVMEAINELHRKIVNAKEDLEEIHTINGDEAGKLKETAEIVLKIEDLLRYLETTFTSPEL